MPTVPVLPDKRVHGPFLRFGNYVPSTLEYSGTVLVVVSPDVKEQPSMRLSISGATVPIEAPKLLATYSGYRFYRFYFALHLTKSQQQATYFLDCAELTGTSFSFTLPANDAPWRWAFYSCNGYDEKPGATPHKGSIYHMWQDMLKNHSESPFHIAVGGGDQIYNDPVWQLPSLLAWLAEKDTSKRVDQEFAEEIKEEVMNYYFTHYLEHFQGAEIGVALATIPHVMSWDDHDIFDGWGSYPPYLQECPAFQGVFECAKFFYLLFQQQAAPGDAADAASLGLFGYQGYSDLKLLGTSTALLLLDTRSERKREQVLSPQSWEVVKQRTEDLPSSVRHLVVVLPVPIIYPKIPMSESILSCLSGESKSSIVWTLMNKTGLASAVMSKFGEPDILDDLMDHWTAGGHCEERKAAVLYFQGLTERKGVRVSFISGDVHCAAFGAFRSNTLGDSIAERLDRRYMAQIVSSAIGNEPPPSTILSLLMRSAKQEALTEDTLEQMLVKFPHNCVLHGHRNYCIVNEHPYSPDNVGHDDNGCLEFMLRVEHPTHSVEEKVDVWSLWVPALQTA